MRDKNEHFDEKGSKISPKPRRNSLLSRANATELFSKNHMKRSPVYHSYDDLLTHDPLSSRSGFMVEQTPKCRRPLQKVLNIMKATASIRKSISLSRAASFDSQKGGSVIPPTPPQIDSVESADLQQKDLTSIEDVVLPQEDVKLMSPDEQLIAQCGNFDEISIYDLTKTLASVQPIECNPCTDQIVDTKLEDLPPTLSSSSSSYSLCSIELNKNVVDNAVALNFDRHEDDSDASDGSATHDLENLLEKTSNIDDNDKLDSQVKVKYVSDLIKKCDTLRRINSIAKSRSITKNSHHMRSSISAFKESLDINSTEADDDIYELPVVSNMQQSLSDKQKRSALINKFVKEEEILYDFFKHLNAMALACSLNQHSSSSLMSPSDTKKLFAGIPELFQFYDTEFNELLRKTQVGDYKCGSYFKNMASNLVHFMSRSEADDCINDIMKKYEHVELFRITIARPIKIKGLDDYILTKDALRRPSQRIVEYTYFLNILSTLSSEDPEENKLVSDAIETFQVYMDIFSMEKLKKLKSPNYRKVISSFDAVQLADGIKSIRMIFFCTDMVVCASYNKKSELSIKWQIPYPQIKIEDKSMIEIADEECRNKNLGTLKMAVETYRADLEIYKTMNPAYKKSQKYMKLLKLVEEEEMKYFLASHTYQVNFYNTQDLKKKITILFTTLQDASEFHQCIRIRSACSFIPICHANTTELSTTIQVALQAAKFVEEGTDKNMEIQENEEFSGYLLINVLSTYRPANSPDAYFTIHLNHAPENFVCKMKTKIFKSSETIDQTELSFFKQTSKLSFTLYAKNDTIIAKDTSEFNLDYLKRNKISRFFYASEVGHFVVFCRFSTECALTTFKSPLFYDGPSITDVANFEKLLIPSIVRISCEHTMSNGCNTQGVYRMSPSKKDLDEAYELYKKGYIFDKRQFSVMDIHLVAVLFKTFLRSLQIPFLSDEVKAALEGWFEKSPTDKELLKTILKGLDDTQYHCLFYIVQHISDFSKFKDVTLMGDATIIKIFNAALFREHSVTYFRGIFDLYCSDPLYFWSGLPPPLFLLDSKYE